ncbi:hypothetical protein PVAND_006590 [Polypedilum vanderplanki]|uniref:J domain-containing protein n=1 Tax=Polypedilum vanderplanki TaxID=319348 RepID=A0A9J6C4F7_POLVA|nr:hypothetical protein PVAND_006590 [Polypedilum vanderplanki]
MASAAVKLHENIELESFLVTKHSAWKGKYKRILSVGTHGIATYNPDKFELTNRWPYQDVISVTPNKNGNSSNEFIITLKKEKKVETIRFSSEFRNDVLTALLKYYKDFAERPRHGTKFNARKHHWSGVKLPVSLEVTPCSLDQLDPTTNTIFASYNYKDIDGIIGIQDVEGGIVLAYGGHSRLHLFMALNHHEIIQSIVQQCNQFLGIDIKVLPTQITLNQFERERFGEYQSDLHQTSLSEFTVKKISPRHIEPPKRFLCLTETTLLERDPQTYNICTLRPLKEIFALTRSSSNIQVFGIEYKNGDIRTYSTNDRDSLLATLLDAVRSSGNMDVHVRSANSERNKRVVPLYTSVDEETEAILLKFIINFYQYPVKRSEVMDRFNANIPYSGLNYSVSQDTLFAENKERLITAALQALSVKDNDAPQLTNLELEASFHVLRRLLASKVGFAAFTNLTGFRESMGSKVVSSLKRNDLAVTYAAIDMINSLMHSMHSDYDLKQEQMNKSSLLQSKQFLESLLDMWTHHISLGSGALILSAMLDFLTFGLCVPYSETTEGKQFDTLLEMVASRGRYIYKLYQHPSLAIVKGAGLLMKALIEEGDSSVANQMQILALDEAALCRHLLIALYTPSNDSTMASHRQISKHLINLWVNENEDALALFSRIFPAGLLTFLDSNEQIPKDAEETDRVNFRDNLKLASQHSSGKNVRLNYLIEKHLEGIKHWGMALFDIEKLQQQQKMQNRPIVLRNRRQKKKKGDSNFNLPLFFYNFHKNHNMPNLIWNHKTREELRAALENELRQFQADKELSGNMLVAWNFEEFEVKYNCLADEIKIGDFYIRLLLENDDWPHNLIKNPTELFNAIYRKVLARNRVNDDQMTIVALQALAKVYQKYHEEIGYFSDITFILLMLDKTLSPSLRDALIGFIKCLVSHKANCRPLLDYITCLIDLITLSHLHKGNVVPNTKTNVIDCGDMKIIEEKDWYYNIEKDKENEKPERCGPVTFSDIKSLYAKGVITARTRLWAIGMDGWRSLQQIPQLKWCLMSKGQPLQNEIDLASEILDILIKCTSFFPSRARDGEAVLIPGPRISRRLSEFTCLPHIVQVCLTHDPRLVERVASLLCQIMSDNPEISKVYLTGVFYFMLMYTGNNILPIVKFLKMTHMKQAFRSDDSFTSDIMHRSILGQMLPEAMVCFLENYSAEKFAEIFLGEFDTPEVIWNSEMRRMLIEKISAHIGDFIPRLKGHTMARYPYLAIPIISYPQLERELFCHIYYLRHLCDTQKFPKWPIQNPVLLLKHTLDAWRKEVEKKPPQMTVKQAYENLGIDLEKNPQPDEALIRKSYYRLAQQYHPDKNPKGKDIFMRVNQAYEFLCSRTSWTTDGPNPNNIFLILKTQSILFERYPQELKPYKYAGYAQLIVTIKMETKDEQLFSKSVPLLNAASELCYHTVHCSALNAEELRREGGLEALLEAYSRCVSIMSADSTSADLHYQIISNITKCFEVACTFEKCKEKIIELPELIVDVCRIVYFKHSLSINLVTSLAANNYQLQCDLIRNGVLWSILLFMFDYDYTLEESGVEIEEKSNKQQVANNLAKYSVIACVALSGYNVDLKLNDKVDDEQVEKSTTTNVESSSDTLSERSKDVNNKTEFKASPTSSSSSNSYTSNASNILQNNQSLIIAANSAVKNESAIHNEEVDQNESNKSNSKSFSKYTISGTAQNIVVKSILDILLTPYIANKLAIEPEHEVLKTLTQNTRNPYLIWDNGTRTQLLDFLEHQRQHSSKEQYADITDIYNTISKFIYDATRDELKIGGVYIRIYNEMPAYPIQNPKMFVLDLLEYLKQARMYLDGSKNINKQQPFIQTSPHKVGMLPKPLIPTPVKNVNQSQGQRNVDSILNNYNRSKIKHQLEKNENGVNKINYDFGSDHKFTEHLIMTLTSLISVMKQNPNVELQCIGNFEIIFGFLNANIQEEKQTIKTLTLEIISLLSRNKECVTEISSCEMLGQFLRIMKDDDFQKQQVLDTLSGLTNAPQLVKEAHQKGVVIYLLDQFCNSNNGQIRETSAELLAKMTSDKLSGPKIRITVTKFLPVVFLDAMIDSPSISVQMFDNEHEHPELIWNEKIRVRVSSIIRRVAEEFSEKQQQNADHIWKDPEILQEISTNELVVSGVYLRLYAQNPGWTLRKPRQFLSDLLDFIVENTCRTGTSKETIDISTSALIGLLSNSPHLADAVPVLGHIPKLFRQLSVQPKSTLSVIHQLALSEVCVAAIAQTECILSLKKCMENEKELVATCCETLTRLFKSQHDSLVRQSLECMLIQYLLNLLETRANLTNNSAAVVAQIVSALKAMAQNLNYGDQVLHILNSNPIWAEFKDQNHDLFIMDTQKRGMIAAGPSNSVAGYLTQAPSKKTDVVMTPPPIDRNDITGYPTEE